MDQRMITGQRISVDIETVFGSGIVVSFTTSDGVEYRGALLSQNPCGSCRHATICSPSSKLANPLSLLHDHPYSKLARYGKHVFNSVPAEVLLRWDTVPSLVTSPSSQGLNGMVSRRTLPSESASSSRTQLVSIENTEELEAYPYYIPGERQAKFLAQLRIKSNAQQLKESLSFGHRSRSLDRFCSSSRGQRKRASLSPHVTNSKAKRQRRETSHSALRVTQKTNVLQKACKVSLKSFTVPLLRVKTK